MTARGILSPGIQLQAVQALHTPLGGAIIPSPPHRFDLSSRLLQATLPIAQFA